MTPQMEDRILQKKGEEHKSSIPIHSLFIGMEQNIFYSKA